MVCTLNPMKNLQKSHCLNILTYFTLQWVEERSNEAVIICSALDFLQVKLEEICAIGSRDLPRKDLFYKNSGLGSHFYKGFHKFVKVTSMNGQSWPLLDI